MIRIALCAVIVYEIYTHAAPNKLIEIRSPIEGLLKNKGNA
jgi:hypothetical protein